LLHFFSERNKRERLAKQDLVHEADY
jgi:hypothetical protein